PTRPPSELLFVHGDRNGRFAGSDVLDGLYGGELVVACIKAGGKVDRPFAINNLSRANFLTVDREGNSGSVQTGSLDGGGHFAFIECVTVFWGGDRWRRGSDGHVSGDLCRLFTVTLLARNEFVLAVAQVDSDRPFTINIGSRVNFLTVHLKGDGGVVQTSTGDLGDRLVDDVAILRRGDRWRRESDGHVSGDVRRLFAFKHLARNEFVLAEAQVDVNRPFTINNGSRANFLTVGFQRDFRAIQTSTGDLGDRLVDDVAILRRGEGRRRNRDLDGVVDDF